MTIDGSFIRVWALRSMIGLGVLWMIVVILSASRSPFAINAGPGADAFTAFEAAFPPRPVPAMALREDGAAVRLPALSRRTGLLLVLFETAACEGCGRTASELQKLVAADGNLAVVRVLVGAADEEAPAGLRTLNDPVGLFSDYAGRNRRRPLVVFYRDGEEIGRVSDTADWTDGAAEALVTSLAAGGHT